MFALLCKIFRTGTHRYGRFSEDVRKKKGKKKKRVKNVAERDVEGGRG